MYSTLIGIIRGCSTAGSSTAAGMGYTCCWYFGMACMLVYSPGLCIKTLCQHIVLPFMVCIPFP